MNPSSKPRLKDSIVIRRVDEDVVAYDPVTDRIALLNTTAALALELCDGMRSTAEIIHEVLACFEDVGEQARVEVRAALSQFRANGLVEAPARGE